MSNHRQFYGYRAEDHPSKKLAFATVCSGCFKPLRKNTRNRVGYICRKCGPAHMRFRQDGIACKFCPFEAECELRVSLGIWLRCETPDFADLERLKRNGGLNDENIMIILEEALEGNGDRARLEEAIAQKAPIIYENILIGQQVQMSVGIPA